ncbi:HAD family hydrolase [uncultured Methanobrevibacter sp.]|uniref:HAD family hydrolase n=1 Tax=uncultured Methanobrevibacter sp. TaxID=253161 RepID=UPI0025EEECF6|nr:HAD family hydrolase [uncultured Methanobrevibacter sp.]
MKKLAIFDFDGTLFNSVDDVVICFDKTLEIYNFPTLTKEEYFECLGGNIDEIVSLVLGKNNSVENIEKVKKTYLDLYNPSPKEHTLPFPEAHECLKKLQEKGVLLAVNSNRLNYSLKYFVEKFFKDIDFVLVEGHNEDYPSKPNPFGVENILRKANVGLDEAVYIGDSKTDIETAQNAGMDCIVVKWGYGNQKDYENDYILEAVDEFGDIQKYF